MKLSIIIVNYKGRDHLGSCLSSIFDHPPKDSFEVIIVDNASNDGSVEFLRENFPEVKLIRNKYNYGFATANNQGFDQTTGEFVMGLNPDAEIVDGSVNEALALFDDESVGIVAPCVLEGSEVVAVYDSYKILSPNRTLKILKILDTNPKLPVPESVKPISWVWGTGYVCRRAALGGHFFDESTFLFAEEPEISERVRKQGYKLLITRDFLIKHIGSVTFNRDRNKVAMARKLMEATLWRHRKHRFGMFFANVHQLLRGADDLFMWSALFSKNLVSDASAVRELNMSTLKANVIASIGLICFGTSYFEKVNAEARAYFNGGEEIPFPPETY